MNRLFAGVCVLLLVLAMVMLVSGLGACGGEDSGVAGSSSVSTGAGSAATTAGSTATSAAGEEVRSLSLDELAEFDGKEGRAAYVAVDGVVYDVSDSARWPDGRHSPCSLGALAGKDLSAEIERAPANMRALLEKMPVVGSLE